METVNVDLANRTVRKRGQGTVEYILLIAVIVAVGLILYRTFESRMLPIVTNIKSKLENEAQWGGRTQVDNYYVQGGGPYGDARIIVDGGI